MFHLWLPLAHVEASTRGRVFLAGALLKLAILALVRFSQLGVAVGTPRLAYFRLLGGGVAGALALRQVDSKKVVAYSRVCHIALALFMLALNCPGVIGLSLLLLLGHGVISPLLFVGVASLGESKGSRSLLIQRG